MVVDLRTRGQIRMLTVLSCKQEALATAFHVCVGRHIPQGLLDPCTNSKLAPNIPAEKLYDKQASGHGCCCVQFA